MKTGVIIKQQSGTTEQETAFADPAWSYSNSRIDPGTPQSFELGHEPDTALPTMLCATRTQVVEADELLGVPELSKLQSAGTTSETSAECDSIFLRSLSS